MDYHIKEILLDDRFQRYHVGTDAADAPKLLRNLSKVNILVGANNCGKSRFLRSLSATQSLKFNPHIHADFRTLERVRIDFQTSLEGLLNRNNITDAQGLMAKCIGLKSLQTLEEGDVGIQGLIGYFRALEALSSIGTLQYSAGFRQINSDTLLLQIKATARTATERLNEVIPHLNQPYTFTRLYVPMLRGLRDFPDFKAGQNVVPDPYFCRTASDYFPTAPAPEIWTGLSLYKQVQNLLLGNLEEREIIAEFQKFIGNNFFDGTRIALIPKLNRSVLDIKIGEEAEYPVYMLGDGIQALILLTFPLFRNRGKKLLFFCEEPEMFMHPGMQRAFLKLIEGDTFPDYQYFLTTHSNHFLDLTLDFPNVSVYAFHKELEKSDKKEKDAVFHVENLSNESRRSLELLGVRNSSVFLSNCTIWVEGVTDRKYFKQYLALYQHSLPAAERRFREDWHYSFVEYGGACITHWSFLDEKEGIDVERLCGKLFLIADGDTATDWKGKRHEQLQKQLGDRFCCLRCKEVENLLSPQVVTQVLRDYGETEIAPVKQEQYTGTALGEFIETAMLAGKKKRSGSYKQDNTLGDKATFCTRAVDAMKSLHDLSPEAQDIAGRLYTFIAQHNT